MIQNDCLEPGLKGYLAVKELQRWRESLNRTPRKLAFVEQIQQERANVIGARLIGRLMEVLRELGNDTGVAPNRPFRYLRDNPVYHQLSLVRNSQMTVMAKLRLNVMQ